jgi:hypothetical protein
MVPDKDIRNDLSIKQSNLLKAVLELHQTYTRL